MIDDVYTLNLRNTKFDEVVELTYLSMLEILECLWMIEENGAPYEFVSITLKKGGEAD